MRETLKISLNGVTFIPPELYTDEEVDAWGEWMSKRFNSGSISKSPGGAGYEIEDFTPIPAYVAKQNTKKYRRLMISAQPRYLEVQFEKLGGSKSDHPVQPLIRAVRYAQHHKLKKRSFPTAKQNFKSQPQEKGAP